MNRASVLIAGAGPAGVIAAYKLAERGIDVLLLEAHPECPEDMRASTFHAPTLDMMDELGLFDALDAQGLRAPVYQYRNRATGEILSFDLGEIADTVKHPYRLQCEQYKLTKLVTGLLADHPNARVLFQRRIIHVVQDDSEVTAHVEAPFAIEEYRADYLIGADGANSIVRKWLGIEFDGFTYPEKFLTLSTAWPLEQSFKNLANVNYVADAKEWCVLLRVPTLWRILVPATGDDLDQWLLSDEKKSEVLSGLIGDGEAVKTHHRTLYKVHQRVAKQYRRGRIVLIGDAAHLNNPLGGFGMNSGIHDAWNLADKLTSILLEGAEADRELDRYERQRRTVMHEFVQAQTIRNKQRLEPKDETAQHTMQADMQAILDDDTRRRNYLLNQAMVTSRIREAEIA
jgi:3-(3-hydroxy-phenyl)propionate hydroxylase